MSTYIHAGTQHRHYCTTFIIALLIMIPPMPLAASKTTTTPCCFLFLLNYHWSSFLFHEMISSQGSDPLRPPSNRRAFLYNRSLQQFAINGPSRKTLFMTQTFILRVLKFSAFVCAHGTQQHISLLESNLIVICLQRGLTAPSFILSPHPHPACVRWQP